MNSTNDFTTNAPTIRTTLRSIATSTITVLALCFASTASYSSETDMLVDEFSTLFAGVSNVGLIVTTNQHGFGAHTYGVNQTAEEMCAMFKTVAPSLDYVIVNHDRADSVIQMHNQCQ